MDNNNYLMHFGIKGMKWGVRRYRNPDGTLTDEGRRRYGLNEHSTDRDVRRALRKSDHKNFKNVGRQYEKALLNDPELKRLRKKMKYTYDVKETMREVARREEKIVNQYIRQFNEARLKDLNYSGNKKVGLEILKRSGAEAVPVVYGNISTNIRPDNRLLNNYGYALYDYLSPMYID